MKTTSVAVTETARAKINLALHVTGRRDDGYHELDSLVAFAEAGDELTIQPAERMALEVTGPFAPQLSDVSQNIVIDAAEAMLAAWPQQFTPVSVHLVKNLPVAAGIGGGSADAAGLLRGLVQIFGPAPDQDEFGEIALQLGADVPVCSFGRACRMCGVGEQLMALPGFPAFAAVLVNPRIAVSTSEVFSKLGLTAGHHAAAPMPELPRGNTGDDWIAWLTECRNDLQPPAIVLVPEIQTVLNALGAAPGCLVHRMSGSGATCFGLFKDKNAALAVADDIAADHPGWWVCPTDIK